MSDDISQCRKGFEDQRKAGISVDWFTWQIAWNDALFAASDQTIERLTRERDAVIQQARIWAQEARTQKATVDEVGAILGGIPDWGTISEIVSAAVKDAEKFQSLVNMRRFMLARKAEITESDRKSYSTSFWDAELSGHEYAVWTALDSAISATTDGGKNAASNI